MSRPTKRARIAHTTHERLPLASDLDFTSIRVREERAAHPALVAPTIHRNEDASWIRRSTWKEPRDDNEYGLDPSGEMYEEEIDNPLIPNVPAAASKSKTRSQVSRRPNVVWKNLYRQTYLDELLRWEGRGDVREDSHCPDCLQRKEKTPGAPEYRCQDCYVPILVCQSCCLRRHRLQPLHVVERWNGSFFVKIPLKSMGLEVQLGHGSLHCSNPVPCHAAFNILHTNGIHSVAVKYCGCERALPIHIQLLRRGFYPASQIVVKTCATFALLRLVHQLSLTSKTSYHDFYRALEAMTVNTGLEVPSSRYRPLMRMSIQWRHLKLLKRGGRGHDPEGIAATKEGELVVPCPTCPHEESLPAGWKDGSGSEKFLYQFILCMDANFRLKNQLISSYSADPGLGIGWAYMVPRETYEKYVLSQATDQDISSCVGFSALAKANTKFSKGLRYTGVGAVTCGRSEMFLPCGVGNLQKGERYSNMDLILASYVRFITALLILISYDVACQWFINLFERMWDWPEGYAIPLGTEVRPALPKMHETGHTRVDHERFSLRYLPGVGLTDGESPERIWAGQNALSNATKTTGPGTRHDVLDDHFSWWNWQKYVSTGKTLARKFKAAVSLRNTQVEAHRGLTATISPEDATKWELMCRQWEEEPFPKSHSQNPFHVDGIGISEPEARKQLAEEEAKSLRAGGVIRHSTSASTFLVLGLDLEDEQRRVSNLAKRHAKGTSHQLASLTEQRNQLRKKIKSWVKVRTVYMPGLLQYLVDHPSDPKSDHPEDTLLWLPSAIPGESRDAVCVPGLVPAEEKLREAQMHDGLDNVRHLLNLKSRMVLFKNKQIRGQRDGTRSRAIIDRVHERARAAADKYSAARTAKMALSGVGVWENEFRVLLPGDIRSYTDVERVTQGPGRRGTVEDGAVASEVGVAPREDVDLFPAERTQRSGTGETRRVLSWIWLVGTHPDGSQTDELLRSEWAKSRARASRAKEEVLLLKEEMRRASVFLQWKADWWEQRGSVRGDILDAGLQEGLAAYAHQQASIQLDLKASFLDLWLDPLSSSDTDEHPIEGPNDGNDDDDSDNGYDDDNNGSMGEEAGDDEGYAYVDNYEDSDDEEE